MKTLLVSGPWGSGTTAVAGLLARLGAVGFGPYLASNDPRTQNTYEFLPFREIVRRYVSVPELSFREPGPGAAEGELRELRSRIERQEFGPYRNAPASPIFLKSPPSALLLPQICRVFDVHLICVMRPLEQIEQSRLRRGWPAVHGRLGAEVIYRHIAGALDSLACPYLRIDYSDVVTSPAETVRRLGQFASLGTTPEQTRQAVDFVGGRAPSPARSSGNADKLRP